MKVTKSNGLLVGLLAAALSVTAITSGYAASTSQIKLAGHLPNIFDPFWKTLQCGADQAAKAGGAKITWANTQNNDASARNQAIATALLSKPAAFITSPDVAIDNALVGMMKKGIAVAALNSNSTKANAYVQTAMSGPADNAIKAAAAMIVKDVGTSGSVGIFAGMAGAQWAIDRYQPIVDAIKAAAPNVKILPIQYEGFDPNKTATMTQALITANPDLKVLYGNTGPSGQGIIAGVAQAGMKGKIKVYAFDAVPAEVAGLKRGEVSALIAQPAGLMGKLAVQNAIAWVKSNPNNKKAVKTGAPAQVDLPMALLTADNVNKAQYKDYQYSETCSIK